MNIEDCISATAKKLASSEAFFGHGTDNPIDEAAYLVLEGLEIGFDDDLDYERELTDSELQKLEKLSSQLPPIELLKHLMNEYDLRQSDLVDIFGSQGYVSDILNGKRELNLRHIKALSRKFNISSQCFLT